MTTSGTAAPANAHGPALSTTRRGVPSTMNKALLALVILLALVVAGGAAFLAIREVPPPTAEMQVEIPNETFQR